MFNFKSFRKDCENKVLIAGYGSLLSEYSRKTFSNIHTMALPTLVKGWERSWLTRSEPEKQTYASAVKSRGSYLSAKLVPLTFDKDFETREQDYRFTLLTPIELEFDPLPTRSENTQLENLLEEIPIYICETLATKQTNEEYPVNLSYLATCLVGAYEHGKMVAIDEFFQLTSGWDSAIFNADTHEPAYPRATPSSHLPFDSLQLLDEYRNGINKK